MATKENNEKINSLFAKTLRELMNESGTSQFQLARAINKTRQTVSQYINGISEPGYDTLIQIADFFGVSVDYLLGVSTVKSTNTDVQDIARLTGLYEPNILRLITWNSLPEISCKPKDELTECEKEVLNAADPHITDLSNNPDENPFRYAKVLYINLINNLIRAIDDFPAQEACRLYDSFINSELAHQEIRNGVQEPLSHDLTMTIKNNGYQILWPQEAANWYLSLLMDGIKERLRAKLDHSVENYVGNDIQKAKEGNSNGYD